MKDKSKIICITNYIKELVNLLFAIWLIFSVILGFLFIDSLYHFESLQNLITDFPISPEQLLVEVMSIICGCITGILLILFLYEIISKVFLSSISVIKSYVKYMSVAILLQAMAKHPDLWVYIWSFSVSYEYGSQNRK